MLYLFLIFFASLVGLLLSTSIKLANPFLLYLLEPCFLSSFLSHSKSCAYYSDSNNQNIFQTQLIIFSFFNNFIKPLSSLFSLRYFLLIVMAYRHNVNKHHQKHPILYYLEHLKFIFLFLPQLVGFINVSASDFIKLLYSLCASFSLICLVIISSKNFSAFKSYLRLFTVVL